jgi:hypothetical protein
MRPVDLQGILCALVELCFHRPVGRHSGGVSAQASALAHSEDSLGDGRTNIHIEKSRHTASRDAVIRQA